jgi:hypothetical protein
MAQHSDWKTYYASLYQQGDGLKRVAAAVARLAQRCREEGIALYLANYPELRDPRDYPFPYVDRAIERIASENGLKYVPLLGAVRELEPESLWVTRPDPHPSVRAHEAFAQALFRLFDAELPALSRSDGPHRL